MTPDEKSSDENRFRERRSAFAEGDEPAPSPADPEDVRPGEEAEPAVEPPRGGVEEESPVVGSAPEREVFPAEEERPAGEASLAEEPGAGGVDLDRLDEIEIPEASFLEIVQPLEIQALQFLGEVPLTESGEKRVLPRWAKHVIDLLGLLEERTRGNLPQDEMQYLDQVLAELRMRYLRVSS